MAKKIKRKDLEQLLTSSLKTVLDSELSLWRISSNSISATIEFFNDTIVSKLLKKEQNSTKFDVFKEILERHTGGGLVPTIVEEENLIIVQVNYDIID